MITYLKDFFNILAQLTFSKYCTHGTHYMLLFDKRIWISGYAIRMLDRCIYSKDSFVRYRFISQAQIFMRGSCFSQIKLSTLCLICAVLRLGFRSSSLDTLNPFSITASPYHFLILKLLTQCLCLCNAESRK